MIEWPPLRKIGFRDCLSTHGDGALRTDRDAGSGGRGGEGGGGFLRAELEMYLDEVGAKTICQQMVEVGRVFVFLLGDDFSGLRHHSRFCFVT